jgi:hypothetical protein
MIKVKFRFYSSGYDYILSVFAYLKTAEGVKIQPARIEAGRLKYVIEYLAGAANFHLVIPIFMNVTVTNRTIDKPA